MSNTKLKIVESSEVTADKLSESIEVLKLQGFEPEHLRLAKCAHCAECPEGAWGLYVTPVIEASLEEGEPCGICFECSHAIYFDPQGTIEKQRLSATDVLVHAGIGKGK